MDDSAFGTVYRLFNYIECTIWIGIGLYLVWRFKSFRPDKILWVGLAVITFILFGISDYFEATTYGRCPYWLWAWKISCGAILFGCRYGYIGIDRGKFYDSHSLLGLAMLIVVLIVIFLTPYVPAE